MIVFNNGVQLIFKDELAKIMGELESLRKENVMLNKDRSALQNINEGLQQKVDILQKQVCNYQDVIANNTTSIRCKELEGEVEQLKQQVTDLEEIIRDDVGAQSDEIHNLKTELNQLEDCYKELLDINHAKHTQVKDQQAIIEFQKNDIERLVKLNAELQQELDTKSKQSVVGDYLKGFVVTSAVTNFGNIKVCHTLNGVVGNTDVTLSLLNGDGLHVDDFGFIEDLIYQNP